MNILFLCTGNTCRSPMAAGLFFTHCSYMTIASAGTSAWPGSPATDNAIAAAAELGADLSAHRSQQATPESLRQADFVICLAASHARHIAPFVPQEKIRVLAGGIADPYGGDLETYRACARQINKTLSSLLPDILCDAKIIPAGKAHLPALAELERQCFTLPASEGRLQEKFSNGHCYGLVALTNDIKPGANSESVPPKETMRLSLREKNNQPVGFITVDEISGEAFVDDLAVSPLQRRKGIASALLAQAEAGAILRGCGKIHLECRESNEAALRLYEMRGYRRVGRRKNYYENPKEDAILMTLEVN